MAPKNATECAIFPLVAGSNVNDTTTPAGKIWQETLATVLSQPGVQRAFYGMEIENPNVLRLVVQWDDMQDHVNFTKAAEYGPMLKNFGTLFDGEPSFWHAKLDPHPGQDALSNTRSPVTEFLSMNFPASYSASAQEDFHKNPVLSIIRAAEQSGTDFRAFTGGWSVESDIKNEKNKEGTRRFTSFLGWGSVDEHMKFRETQGFKDTIGGLRGAPELVDMNVVHVSFTVVQSPRSGASQVDTGVPVQEEVLNPQS